MGKSGIDFKAAQKLLDQKKKEKADSGKGTGSDVNWMRLPETGELKVRFLPPTEDEPVPGMVVYKHYSLPEHEGIRGNITCFKTWGLDCPICKVIEEYQDRLKLDDFFGASSYFNVLVLDHPECNPRVPYLLQASEYTYEWLLQQLVNVEVGDITDVEDGANVTFQRKKKKGAFNRIISRKSTAIANSPEEIDAILDAMYTMKSIWKSPDDNYYNIAEELADQLREIIEDRLIRSEKEAGDKGKGVKEVRDAKHQRSSAGDAGAAEGDAGGDGGEPEETTPPPRSQRRTAGSEGTKTTTRGRAHAPAQDKEPEAPEEPEEKTPPAPPAGRGAARKPREDKGGGTPPSEEKKTPVSGKPAKAPACFGVDHSDERKCQICPFEYDCENAG